MNEKQSEALGKVNALLQEQRNAAYDAARLRIAGHEPTLEYATAQGRFSQSFMVGVQVMVGFMMLVAFLPSAMRIHQVALIAAGELLGAGNASQYLSALCVVFLAEVCQIAFSIAFATASNRYERIGYGIGAFFGTAIALAGNGTASKLVIDINAIAFKDIFNLLDTFAPPIITLIAAWVLKSQALHAAELRTQAQLEYANAKQDWNTAYTNASQHSEWNSTIANALRDAIRNANRRSYAMIRALTDSDWRALILRERSAEEWWNATEAHEQLRLEQERIATEQTQQKAHSGDRSTGATGEVVNAISKRDGDAFVRVCPHCAREFSADTERSATNKLVAHMKAHKNEALRHASDALPAQVVMDANGRKIQVN